MFLIISFLICQIFIGATAGFLRKPCHLKEAKDLEKGQEVLSASLGVFKEGPDAYLLTFSEDVDPPKDEGPIGSEAFNENLYPPLWSPNSTEIRRRHRRDEDESGDEITTMEPMYQEELRVDSEIAERIISHLLKTTEKERKGLGVCRKVVPKHFFNPPVDNATSLVIKGIVDCVQDKLQDDLGCHACLTLHPDLQNFLAWLIKGNPGMPCCPPRHEAEEKIMFLFNGQEGFGGVECSTNAGKLDRLCAEVSRPPSPGNAPPTGKPVKKVEQFGRRGDIKPITLHE